MDRWTIAGARLITPDRVIEPGYITVDGGEIVHIGRGKPGDAGRKISAPGTTVTPGLIDIHTHGAMGNWAFFDKKGLLEMARALPAFGVTAFCPTTVSLPHKQVLSSITAIREAMSEQEAGRDYSAEPASPPKTGSRILGINLEGPYINKTRPGAHIPTCIRNPEESEVGKILDAAGDCLRIATIAPELPGGLELARRLATAGAVVSIGHSDADRDQTLHAVDSGARLMTHLFNAMRGFHQREPGCAFTALMTPGLYCELIADGKHVHPEILRMSAKLKPASELILITDSISAAGMPPGKYNVWGFEVEVKDGTSRLPDGTIAGSVLTLNRGVANMARFTELPLERCVAMATINPATLLGLQGGAGRLVHGAAADISMFDGDMNCIATVIAGHTVYRSEKSPL